MGWDGGNGRGWDGMGMEMVRGKGLNGARRTGQQSSAVQSSAQCVALVPRYSGVQWCTSLLYLPPVVVDGGRMRT